jgi:WS/DGAT/MGAT family acyltransferase
MRPLEGMDAAFVALESPTSHLHVAAVLVLDPPEGTRSLYSPSTRFAQIRRVVAERVHLVPPLRQRLVTMPLGLDHPAWVDDPDFDLEDHVRRLGAPEPGDEAALEQAVGEIMSRPLPLDRPPWELVVVEGLQGERTAVVARLHHAIVDGVSGAALLAAFLDDGPRSRPVPAPDPWDPPPLPAFGELVRQTVTRFPRQARALSQLLQRGVEAVADVGIHNRELAAEGVDPPPPPFRAPRTSLNGTISSRRRYATAAVPLPQLRLVGHTFGATVNDVLLAGVAGALHRHLESRHEPTDEALVALVPVSTRPRTRIPGVEPLGNQVSAMLVSLATDKDDAVARLQAIAASARAAKTQEALLGGDLFREAAQVAVPAVAGRAARWAAGLSLFDRVRPMFNVTVSNVPGPPTALWCAGARAVALYPVGPVAEGAGLNVTALTYDDTVHLGLLTCRRLLPKPGTLARHLAGALEELVRRAQSAHVMAV